MKYQIIVSGEILTTTKTREEAERLLNEARHSFLAMVHPQECFYIRQVTIKNA